jgi:hypothetical protein
MSDVETTQAEDGFRDGLPEDDALANAFTRPRRRRKAGGSASSEPQSAGDVATAPPAEPAPAPAPEPEAEPEQPTAPVAEAAPVAASSPIPAQAAPEPEPAAGREVVVHPVTPLPERADAPLPVGELLAAAAAQTGPSANTATQCTVNVSAGVRERFTAYQTTKRLETGAEPTNAIVVLRAVLHARKHDAFAAMREYLRHQQHPVTEDDDDPDGLFGDVEGRRAQRGRTKDSRQLPFRPSHRELAVIDILTRGYGFANRSEFLDAALNAFLPQVDKRRR